MRGDESACATTPSFGRKLLEVQAKEAPKGDVQACHTPQLYKQIERVVSEGTGYLDSDTSFRCDRWTPPCAVQARLVRRLI